MVFVVRSKRPKQGKQARMLAGVSAAVGATTGVISHYAAHATQRLHGDIGSSATLLLFGAVIAIPVVAFFIMGAMRAGDDDQATQDDAGSTTESVRDAEDDENRKPFALIAGVVALLAAVVMALIAFSHPAHAQGAPDRGAFVVLNGTDTVIVDRFTRTADSLLGSVSMKNQPRVEYTAALGPDNTVRTLLVRVVKVGAGPGDAPLQEVFTTMQGDSAIISMGGNTIRVAAGAGAVPSVGNAFALFEPFTRRARLTGGVGDYPYFAMAGARSLPLTVRPAGTDTLIVTIAGQAQHLRVDAVGRILGGFIIGQPAVIKRVGERDAAKITFGTAAAKPTERPDYSAPAGAPYTAEEVSFKGPGGITLGGTLTKPLNVRGPLPAVVTITGSGQQDRDEYIPLAGGIRLFRQVADTLSRVGIAVLRLDDRGFGASTGNFSTSTTLDFADDIRAALAYLRSRPDVDGDRLALVGHSEGGIIAPMVAASDPKLRAIAIMAGPADKMVDVILAQNKWVLDQQSGSSLRRVQRDSVLADARSMLAPERQLSSALKFWTSYDPAPVARKVESGDADSPGRDRPPGSSGKCGKARDAHSIRRKQGCDGSPLSEHRSPVSRRPDRRLSRYVQAREDEQGEPGDSRGVGRLDGGEDREARSSEVGGDRMQRRRSPAHRLSRRRVIDVHARCGGAADALTRPTHDQCERPIEWLARRHANRGPRYDPQFREIAQELRVAIAHADHAGARANRQVGDARETPLVHAAGRRGNRCAVRIGRWIPQCIGHSIDQLRARRMLQPLGFLVNIGPAVAEFRDEKALDDPVAPQQLQCHHAAGRGETRATVPFHFHEAKARETHEHAAHARRGDIELSGDLGRRRGRPSLLYLIDDFEVVLGLPGERFFVTRAHQLPPPGRSRTSSTGTSDWWRTSFATLP